MKFFMKTGIGLLVAGALIAASAGVGRAADTTAPTTPGTGTTQPKKHNKPATKRTNGTVVSATATSLVIKLGKRAGGGEKTFEVPDTAKVMSGRTAIKLDSLTAGQRVSVTTLEDGTTVKRVNLQIKKTPATTAPAAPAPAGQK